MTFLEMNLNKKYFFKQMRCFASFQQPAHASRCNLAVVKNIVGFNKNTEAHLIRFSSEIGEGSEFVFINNTTIEEEISCVSYHSDAIYLGFVGKIMIIDPNSLECLNSLALFNSEEYMSPSIKSIHFEGDLLCVGCSDASIQIFKLESEGFRFKTNIVLPSSLVEQSFIYSEGLLFFATLSGYVGRLSLLNFEYELEATNQDIDTIAVYNEQIYVATMTGCILIYKKQPKYEIFEQINLNLDNERIVSLYINYPFIFMLSDKGVCYKCDPTVQDNGIFTVIKAGKEFNVESNSTALQNQEGTNKIECIGAVQADNCCACVCINEFGEINSLVAPLE